MQNQEKHILGNDMFFICKLHIISFKMITQNRYVQYIMHNLHLSKCFLKITYNTFYSS